jgi:hypothetical protein
MPIHIVLTPLVIFGQIYSQARMGDKIQSYGRKILYRSQTQQIEIDTPKLNPKLETGYLAEPFSPGSTSTYLNVWQIERDPQKSDSSGSFFKFTIFTAEFGQEHSHATMRKSGQFCFWGTRNRTQEIIEFHINKISGARAPALRDFQIKAFPGFPALTPAP